MEKPTYKKYWEANSSDERQQVVENAFDLIDKLEQQLLIQPVGNLLKDKKEPPIKDAFIAGYKKRAEMSGLKYDDVSELNAITCFKCWKSFDL